MLFVLIADYLAASSMAVPPSKSAIPYGSIDYYSSAEYAEGFLNRQPIILRYFHQYAVPQVVRRIAPQTNSWGMTVSMVNDVITETYLDVFEKLDEEVYQEKGKFLAYFTSIAYNKARKGDLMSSHKNITLCAPADLPTLQKDYFVTPETKTTLAQSSKFSVAKSLPFFEKLNVRYQQLLRLHFENGLTYQEMEIETGRSENNIKVSFKRIREQLQKWVRQQKNSHEE